MGGGRRFEYPKHVWSPAGGWWANPTHWKRNTAIYIGVAGFILYSINEATKSKIVKYERKPPSLPFPAEGDHGHGH
eukprot:gene293-307_t